MSKSFEDILAKVKNASKKKLSVAYAQDEHVLEAVELAHQKGIVDAILVGDETKIKEIAGKLGMNIDEYEIIDVKDMQEAAHTAVELVHDGKADIYMKGSLDSKTIFKERT